jgi:hypothetical protein
MQMKPSLGNKDVSGSMLGKDIVGVYRELDKHLADLPGSKSICGIFGDRVEFYSRDELIEALRHPPEVGGGTNFGESLRRLQAEIQKAHPGSEVINFYVITDADFSESDFKWLVNVDRDASYNITFVTQSSWISLSARQQLSGLQRIKLMLV